MPDQKLSTVQPEDDPSSLSTGPPDLGRLRLGRLIGRGGMGQVYEAHDPHLKRTVAVKLLRHAAPADVRRFVREARAQAAQTHPDVCPVYEAGEADGTPYIVMKRVDGLPLDEATAEWPLERRLRLLRRIAEAVHAAHRTGLVHRDLKPGNILVEQPTDGEAKPWVLDFGLARPVADGGTGADILTLDGDVVGTPGYMAPEQLRGEGEALDRRTDVYALGATLYHLLAGSPPFPGSGITALRTAVENDPAPLRPRGVPRDVEAIVFKCLEKEPERRYSSARALAEDLGRYLDDEPVTARPNSDWYRFRKWTRRHRAVLRLSAVFGVLLFAALAWGAVTAWRASERERLARRFTEQVEEMEAVARYSHMAPLHDVRPDRDLVRRRMDAIRQEMTGSRARAAGHYALGRGFLALEQPLEAYRELTTAWDGGYREPEVAAALARALSALYRDGLAAAEMLGDWESRQRRLARLEEEYGRPAREFLAQSSDPAAATAEPFLAALVPFHAGRFEEALALLADDAGRRPWSYELDVLEGDVRRSLATRHQVDDKSPDARTQLELARSAYERAAATAPSDPAVARAASQVAVLLGLWQVLTGENLQPVLERGLESVGRALEAHPEDGRSWLWRARLHRLAAQSSRVRSEDPGTPLAEANAAAERAAALLPEPSEAFLELGRIHWQRAQWQREKGADPTAAVEATIAALEKVDPELRDYMHYFSLGLAHMTLGDHRADRGVEAASSFERAIDAYRSAAELHSSPFAATNNVGICLLKKSQLPATENRLSLLRDAITALEAAQKLDPDHVAPHYYLGQSYLRLAQGGIPASGLLGDEVDRALASFEQALELHPGMVVLHNSLGEIRHLQAVHAFEQGGDPEPFFVLARREYEAGLEAAPRHAFFHQNLAWTAYFEGKVRVRTGREADSRFDEALRHAHRALELSTQPGAWLLIGSVHRLRAEAALDRGGDPSPWLARAEQALNQVLELNPRHPEAHRSLGRLYTLEARSSAAAGGDPTAAFGRAREALGRALELEPAVAYFHLALARWALERDRWRASDEIRELGLESAEKALELRPGWPEAVDLRTLLRR